jgi:addiction module HigA family antidote
MHRLPTHRAPTHPGEMLSLEFLAPLDMTQVELAERIGVPFQRVNQIVRRKRAVTPDSALRLARLFGTTAEFWLNLQQAWDLYQATHSPAAHKIAEIQPIKKAG